MNITFKEVHMLCTWKQRKVDLNSDGQMPGGDEGSPLEVDCVGSK